MDKKRLILVVSVFPQSSETFIVSKFLGLLERGWSVHLVCSRFDKTTIRRFPQLKATPRIQRHIHRIWPHELKWIAALLFIPGFLSCLASAPRSTWQYLRRGWAHFGWGVLRHFYLDMPIIRLNPDIVHFEFGALAVGRTYLKDVLGARISVSFRGYDLNFVALDDLDHYRAVWDAADACHFLSEHLWQRAQERGCPADKSHQLIAPAVDLETFAEIQLKAPLTLGTPEQPLRILSIGRLEWKKGYEHALVAMKFLREQGVVYKYIIAGDGNYAAALYYARHQLGLVDLVDFYGALPHKDVLKHMAQADVLVHPSLSEGFCNTVLEAQATGIPVVSTDAGGLPENITDGVTGFIIPRRAPKAMSEKLALLAQDGNLRQRMGLAGRQRVEKHFQLKQQLDAFEKFYENL
jgi:colanic acid/amylovoran biosynthesis glycosyltransferase